MALFKKRKHKSIVWGIRVEPHFRDNWLILSGIMGVPCNRLVIYILGDWMKQYGKTLIDGEKRAHLAAKINQAFFEKRRK